MESSSIKRYLLIFVLLTFVVGMSFWFSVDEDHWWAKVERPEQPPLYKFKMTELEQAIISLIVGTVFAAPLTLVCICIQHWRQKISEKA